MAFSFQWWHLIIMVVVALIGYLGNHRYFKYFIKAVASDVVTPVIKAVNTMEINNTNQHKSLVRSIREVKEVATTNKDRLNRFESNTAFYQSMEKTVQETMRFLNIDGQEPKACRYVERIGRSAMEFFREVYQIGVNDISDEMVNSKAERYIGEAKDFGYQLFTREYCDKYYEKYKNITPCFIASVCQISDSEANSKETRFRTTTKKYLEDITNAFSNYFSAHKKSMNLSENIDK